MRRRLAASLARSSIVLLFGPVTTVAAATLVVGPGQPIATVADAARLARDGDTVAIMPGAYRGDVAVWRQKKLRIIGLPPGAVLQAAGNSAEGKAIWVFRDGDFTVENVEFRGARVADRNGAGIRFERGRLEVVGCRFIDNQTGILTANFSDSILVIRDSEFRDAPAVPGGLPHLLYVGRIDFFEISGSHLHGGHRGHLLKSRARRSRIAYNLILDDPTGSASYEIDLPDGGDVELVGNIVGQSAHTDNPTVIAYGAEGAIWPNNRLHAAHNTMLASGWRPAWFVRSWIDGAEIVTRNNVTIGLGVFTSLLAGDHRGNLALPPDTFDLATLELRPPFDRMVAAWPPAPPVEGLHPLRPLRRFVRPIGTVVRDDFGAAAPGAVPP
ncbi:MAG: hypothetical protein KDH17_11205 [Rhodocyclaceae bacterium]|nr:hypothetical protein [Rhodocyclaceae bacterium]